MNTYLLGLSLGLAAGFFEAIINIFINHKKKSIPPILMGLAGFLILFPLSLVLLFFTEIPKVTIYFWILLVVISILNVVARILYVKAIHLSGMAKTIPFLSFTPIFLIIVAFVIVKELPTLLGASGIILIVVGAFVLSKKKDVPFFPTIKKENGALLMLGAAFLFSFSASLAKLLFNWASTLFVIICLMLMQPIFFLIAAVKESNLKKISKYVKKDASFFLITGLLSVLLELSGFFGLSLVNVAYVISLKRTNILFSIIFGYLFFKEPGFRKNLFAGILMMLGVLMIGVYG